MVSVGLSYAAFDFNSPKEKIMSNVVETVEFSLTPGTTESDFLATNDKMDAFLATQAGLIYRSLCKKADGTYVDIVYWQDMESAKVAQEAYYESAVCKAIGPLINMESVKLEHAEVIATFGCDS